MNRDDFVVKLKVGRGGRHGHGRKGWRSRKYRIWIDHDMCGFHVPPMDKEGLIVVGIHPKCKAGTKDELDTALAVLA